MSMELLQLPSILAKKAGYYDFRGNNTLEVKIPKEFQNHESNEELIANLAPPPSAKSNEILATNSAGSAQVLFVDRSALTIAPNSWNTGLAIW